MGKFGSDRNSSSGGGSTFKSRPSGIKKHSGGDKRHASEAPTGKFGFARLQNDDGGALDVAGRESSSGRTAHTGSRSKKKSRGDGSGQSQAGAATSVRSALKNVAVEHLVAGGAKKSMLLQKVYDCDAFTGKLNTPEHSHMNAAHYSMHSNAFKRSTSAAGLASMDAAQRLQLFWVAATSMRDSPASSLAAPSPDVFRYVRDARD